MKLAFWRHFYHKQKMASDCSSKEQTLSQIKTKNNRSIKRTFALGCAVWLHVAGRTAESMISFGKAVRRYRQPKLQCHFRALYVHINAAALLYKAGRSHLETGRFWAFLPGALRGSLWRYAPPQ